jgi:amidase
MAFSALTIGTETSGSILSPSEANGVVGVKPTLGLTSRAGILPLAPSFDVPGPMVRSVTDAALTLNAIAGPDPRDPATAGAQLPPGGDFTRGLKRDALKGKRLAYSDDAYESLSDEERALFDAAIEKLEKLGATVVAVQALDAQYVGLTEIAAIPNEFKASLNEYLVEEMPTAKRKSLTEIVEYNKTRPDRVKYGQNLLEASDRTPGRKELFPVQAEPARQSARADIDAALTEGDADAIITPGNVHANVGAAAGYPTVMVPLGYTARGIRAQGIGFMGRAYSEPDLLAFAYAYEQAGRVRTAPTEINASKLQPGTCPKVAGGAPGRSVVAAPTAPGGPGAAPPSGGAPAPRPLRPLRVTLRRSGGGILRVVVRGVAGTRVRFVVRRGKRVVARRVVRPRNTIARTFFRARRRGAYRVTVTDLGASPRTARSRIVRVR